jgi:hypothetical protein
VVVTEFTRVVLEPGDRRLERGDGIAARGERGADRGGDDRLPDAGARPRDEDPPQ